MGNIELINTGRLTEKQVRDIKKSLHRKISMPFNAKRNSIQAVPIAVSHYLFVPQYAAYLVRRRQF